MFLCILIDELEYTHQMCYIFNLRRQFTVEKEIEGSINLLDIHLVYNDVVKLTRIGSERMCRSNFNSIQILLSVTK